MCVVRECQRCTNCYSVHNNNNFSVNVCSPINSQNWQRRNDADSNQPKQPITWPDNIYTQSFRLQLYTYDYMSK